ncbi:DUF3267 domain-containing protein [Corynebacterium sp. YIM 101645]|uniref:DUF3267 domain-containing protein n=1 Tax=Corynebacterium lemuris TaxID=1859292 RepID=A0ABT2FWA6_9CORY|nr:DUF3267 domain-containing protein [Corynebacterium lemuris]MCS5479511.1 DUF3267 domain-containing protein [Corynebacterium lemuris]
MEIRARNTSRLPAGYHRHATIDLKKNRGFNLWVQGTAVAVVAPAIALGIRLEIPAAATWSPLATTVLTILAGLCYLAAHELTHGLVLRWRTGITPTYAVKFPFVTTGSPAYLNPGTTTLVALTPSLLWGAILLTALLLVPAELRLTLYILVVLNFAGSSGDYVEAAVALRQPPESLIRDDGTEIGIYRPRESAPATG